MPPTPVRLITLLINLDRAEDRLALIAPRLDSLELEWNRVSAIDGTSLSFPIPEFSELSYMLLHGRRRTPAEVGCYLSHVECARRLLASDATHGLVLEDDVLFASDFRASLDAAMQAEAEWDILRLSTVNSGRAFPYRPLVQGRSLGVALSREKGAGAYVINRRAARWFVKRLLPMRLAFDIAFDLEYLAGLRAVFVTPVPADQVSAQMASQIQGNIRAFRLPRWRYFTVLPYRTWLELSRFTIRGFWLIWRWLRSRFGAIRSK